MDHNLRLFRHALDPLGDGLQHVSGWCQTGGADCIDTEDMFPRVVRPAAGAAPSSGPVLTSESGFDFD